MNNIQFLLPSRSNNNNNNKRASFVLCEKISRRNLVYSKADQKCLVNVSSIQSLQRQPIRIKNEIDSFPDKALRKKKVALKDSTPLRKLSTMSKDAADCTRTLTLRFATKATSADRRNYTGLSSYPSLYESGAE
ncbi:hypothetical protein CEXT_691471 [Caerostris extrusa]|uniref:Uncharacterized protein n=1 Tax=Caerostris extrusa TaxID=172846 RepID=A0AAV4SKZ9_CAEEX|nr:hypothetical protein CEXT_691471 [Caerostris extrusa]